VNLGLLLLRVLLAGLLFGHSMQKLRGWFGGAGLTGTGAIFQQWGFVPGARMALLAACMELLGAPPPYWPASRPLLSPSSSAPAS
jgi:putative oxidoreductase